MDDSEGFIEYSNYVDDIYKNIEQYNPNKECKLIIAFDDMVADMLSSKNHNPIVTEFFISGRKLNISFFFFLFHYPENIRLNSMHYVIKKIPN